MWPSSVDLVLISYIRLLGELVLLLLVLRLFLLWKVSPAIEGTEAGASYPQSRSHLREQPWHTTFWGVVLFQLTTDNLFFAALFMWSYGRYCLSCTQLPLETLLMTWQCNRHGCSYLAGCWLWNYAVSLLFLLAAPSCLCVLATGSFQVGLSFFGVLITVQCLHNRMRRSPYSNVCKNKLEGRLVAVVVWLSDLWQAQSFALWRGWLRP